jgi:HEAT repeat protein
MMISNIHKAALALFTMLLLLASVQVVMAADDAEDTYRKARRALNRSAYVKAAEYFAQVHTDHGGSKYAADALYWDAFARYRIGKREGMRTAIRLLDRQRDHFPKATTIPDARELAVRIEGKLAELGEGEAIYHVYRDAERLASESVRTEHKLARLEFVAATDLRDLRTPHRSEAELAEQAELEMRLMALNALMNMDSERAVPILKKVLSDQETHAELRTKALFILSQANGEEAEEILLQVLREDKDPEVRKMAVFWLGQSSSDESLTLLSGLLKSETEAGIKEQLLFAIGQNASSRAMEILKDLVRDKKTHAEEREMAIFWIGQRGDAESIEILKDIYKELDSREAKERVLFSVAQNEHDGIDWLLSVMRDKKEEMELRGRALFWAGQSGEVPLGDIVAFYNEVEDEEIKEQVLFTLAQHGSDEAIDELMKIVSEEDSIELRTRAIFWIGQSNHPRVVEFLEEIISH